MYKVFLNCVLDRIKKKAEQRMGDYQGGFRAGRSMTDQMFMVRKMF